MMPKTPQKYKNLWLRARIIQAIRTFFINHGYLEVETPCRIPAPAPEANIDAQPAGDWYLQTSPELCMKRMLAAGHPKIFQICKCFRRHERGIKHLPELTLLEWYTAGDDYNGMMDQSEKLIRFVSRTIGAENPVTYGDCRIELNDAWERLNVAEAFHRYGSLSMEAALAADTFDEIMAFEIEPKLGIKKPVFLYDYPAACGALARLKPGDTSKVERFELYIAGLELCNAFSELTDPEEQHNRFKTENASRQQAGKSVYPMAEKFLQSLEHMPESTGNALGVDRLVMLFAGTDRIDDVVVFAPEDL